MVFRDLVLMFLCAFGVFEEAGVVEDEDVAGG